ncbi:hypothetical protein [Conexibacter sp. CPCC 206217]|uniref:Vgb family protein n=1 Tax=Conexibacter sp. CPCC 206217 TaxID=3064574 RepID=UPI00272157FF|nr:hypothetical protein [Conexibacter sp. CPCC 206217]MDO8212275.1 hypothetical protein [Conexibacter sp. CPCC 206217]
MSHQRLIPLLLLVLAAALLAPAAAGAVPVVSGEFPPAGFADTPGQLTTDPAGNAWVVLGGTDDVAEVTPDGTVRTYDATDIANPVDITLGPNGDLWVSQANGVARFSPSDPRRATAYAIPTVAGKRGITTGPDQNIWFVAGDQAVQVNPADGREIRSFPVTGMDARGITTGGGNLWIADFGGNRIVQLTTAGVPTFYDTGVNSAPQEVVAGLGAQVGYTAPGLDPDEVGLITPPDPAIRVPAPRTDATGIAFGLDQAYWAADFLSSDLTRLTSTGTVTTLTGLSANSGPRQITAGLNGTLWVSLETSRRIALVTGLEAPPPVVPPVTPPTGPSPPNPPQIPNPPGAQPVFARVSLTRTITQGRSATLRVAVTSAGTVFVRVERKLSGRRSGRRCVAPTRRNRRARACSRYVTRATLRLPVSRTGNATGRFGARLSAGSYRVSISAGNAVGTARTSKPLTIKPRARARPVRR